MFSTSETLTAEYKYYCEQCCSKQEATKRLRVKHLPQILALHLKRFKYVEQSHRYTKLSHRVVFPWELKLFNTVGKCKVDALSVWVCLHWWFCVTDNTLLPLIHTCTQSDYAENADRMYDLIGVVVHCGR